MRFVRPGGSIIWQRPADVFDQPAPGDDDADSDIDDDKDVKCRGCHKIHLGLRAVCRANARPAPSS